MRDARLRGYTTEKILLEFGVKPASNGQWKSFECPFCHRKKANVFPHEGIMLFKCMFNACSSDGKAMAEPQLVARLSNLTDREGFIQYLKMAGVWKDVGKQPKNGASARPSSGAVAPAEPRPGNSPAPAGEGALPNPVLPPTAEIPTAKPEDLLKLLDDPDPTVFLSVAEKIKSIGAAALDWLRPAVLQDAVTPEDFARRSRINDLIRELTAEPRLGTKPVALTDGTNGTDGTNAGTPTGSRTSASQAGEPAGVDARATLPEDPKKLLGYGSGRLMLREFYEALVWLEEDENKIYEKRAIESRTSVALGFRSNPKSNEANIRRLLEKWGFRESLASGLWLPRDAAKKKESRPNNQFFGFGQSGRKPEAKRKGKDDKFVWSFCQPILIPYFNDLGELVALRPHKGGALGGTAAGHSTHVYIPRDVDAMTGDQAEKYAEIFETVVVTEGEFKAAALWQVVGAGGKTAACPSAWRRSRASPSQIIS